MTLRRLGSIALAANLAAVFGLALWFRVTSLRTVPEPHGDEAFYGVQAARLLSGQSIARETASGKLLNHILLALDVPLVWAFEPSYTILRIPAALAGIAAVALTFLLLRRALDPTTATVAAGLLAALPIAIIYSRIGWEPSQVPLATLLPIAFAFRGKRIAALVTFLIAVYVHPVCVLLAPAVLGVLLVVLLRDSAGQPARARWTRLVATAAVAAAVVVPIALANRDSRAARWTRETFRFKPHNWPLFFQQWEKHLLGLCQGVPTATSRPHDVAFWAIAGGVLALGTYRLARQRAWDRLALVAGTAASAATLHLAVGPDGFHPEIPRYGLFLAVPTVLSFACLARSLLVEPAGGWRSAVRGAQSAGLVGLAYLLLLSFKLNYADVIVAQHPGRESLWTMRTEAVEPMARATRIILNDLRANAPRERTAVVTQDWWVYRPIEFYAWRERDVRVLSLEHVGPDARKATLRRQLDAGGYAVGRAGEFVEAIVAELYPPERLRRWPVQAGVQPLHYIYRLRTPAEEAVARAGGTVVR